MKKELVYLSGQEVLDAIKSVQSESVTKQRLKFLNSKIGDYHLGASNRTFSVSKMWWNDGTFYYACDTYTLFLSASGKLFTTSRNYQGLTYEPENKHNLKLWGSTKLSNINHSVIDTMLVNAGAEWALETDKHDYKMLYRLYTHKGLFQRILKGRITNAEDLVRAYLKLDTRWRELKISHRAKTILTLMRRGIDKGELIDFLSIVSNVEATLDILLQGKKLGQWTAVNDENKYIRDVDGSYVREWHFDWYALDGQTQHDIRKELVILDKKINSTWSAKRLMTEHTEMSRQILDLEVEDMVLEDHGYKTPCPVLPGMELISDNIRLYTEGRKMEHCIFSYLRGAQTRTYFHFHCIFGGEPFSLSVEKDRWGKKTWIVQQMHGKYNSTCAPIQQVIVHAWLNEDAVQQWFSNERAIAKPDDSNDSVDW